MKIVLSDLNQNPETKIPDFLKNSLSEIFPLAEIVIVQSPNNLRKAIVDADYLLGWAAPSVFLKKAQKLKSVFLFSSQIPDSYSKLPFEIRNITGLNAEYVVSYILEVLSNHTYKNTLIIGQGAIGKLLKSKLPKKNLRVITRTPTDELETDYKDFQLEVSKADVIIPCVSLNSDTKCLFENSNFFKFLKEDVLVINTARGELFEEKDLLHFFKTNPKAFYHTDVTVPEPYPKDGALRSLSNIKITNHVAGFGTGIWQKINEQIKNLAQEWK